MNSQPHPKPHSLADIPRDSLACVTGRFQPLHDQHLELFEIALAHCEHLIIAITNPDPGARQAEPSSAHRHTAQANPFTYYERVRLIKVAISARALEARCTLVPFDLVRKEIWPQYVPLAARQFVRCYGDWEREKARWFEAGGYPVTLIEGLAFNRHSASTIRASMRAGGDAWQRLVPVATLTLLEQFLAETPMNTRT